MVGGGGAGRGREGHGKATAGPRRSRTARACGWVGEQDNEKRLKDTYGSEADAMAAARAERGRIERGKATMELTPAIGRPELMPQTPVVLQGFKDVIDATDWLVVKLTHTLGDGGLNTRIELETRTTDQFH